MTHLEIYRYLLAPERRWSLLPLLEAQGYQGVLGYTGARFVDAEPYPYLLLDVPADNQRIGHAGGLMLQLIDSPEIEQEGRYYLPVVGLVDANDAIGLAHELCHLADLIALIARDPDYPARVERFGHIDPHDKVEVAAHIDHELHKIFTLEPPAFRGEYRAGVRHIDVPLLPGMNVPVPFRTEEEFVQAWMSDYVIKLEAGFVRLYPFHKDSVQRAVEQSTNRHGAAVFGRKAMRRVRETQAILLARLRQLIQVRVRPG